MWKVKLLLCRVGPDPLGTYFSGMVKTHCLIIIYYVKNLLCTDEVHFLLEDDGSSKNHKIFKDALRSVLPQIFHADLCTLWGIPPAFFPEQKQILYWHAHGCVGCPKIKNLM